MLNSNTRRVLQAFKGLQLVKVQSAADSVQHKKNQNEPKANEYVKNLKPVEKLGFETFQEELKKNSDNFGNYADISSHFEKAKDDPDDIQERRRLKQMDRRNPAYYIDVVKTHLDKHEFGKALEFVEERMLKVDKVKPDSYIYDLLISYCGRTGNAKEAFRLYNQIKKRGWNVTGGQYTSVFNAAAQSRSSNLALDVAFKVRKGLAKDELHKANIKNYNAMLKAFGRHGELKTCLEIMDEVIERRGRVQEDTYNFLLQACVTDANSGFRHALLVWHKLLQNKTDPSVFSFNLMLRVVRDCSIGAPERLHQLFQSILKEKSTRFLRKLKEQNAKPVLPSSATDENDVEAKSQPPILSADSFYQITDDKVDASAESQLTPSSGERMDEEIKSLESVEAIPPAGFDGSGTVASLREEAKLGLPNMLAIRPKMGTVIDLTLFSTPYHRLMLLGGAVGFLQVMDSIGIKPDMKTFTLLLEIIPSTKEAEEDLIDIIKEKKIKFDCGFFNTLIKKRCFRFDDAGAKEVLNLMQMESIAPDLMTFGCLALSCRRQEDGEALLESLKEAGFRPNSQILGPLIKHATYQHDLQYVRMVLNVMKEEEVQPGPKLLSSIDNFMKKQKAKLQV